MRKVYDLFIYDIPNFIKNIYIFRYSLWNYQTWDYVGVLLLMRDGLSFLKDNYQHHGNDYLSESTTKKNKSIERVIELLTHTIDDNYFDIANKQLGEIEFPGLEFSELEDGSFEILSKNSPAQDLEYKKRMKLSIELEKSEWDELFKLLKGQDYSKFKKDIDWDQQYDGSGIKTWWE